MVQMEPTRVVPGNNCIFSLDETTETTIVEEESLCEIRNPFHSFTFSRENLKLREKTRENGSGGDHGGAQRSSDVRQRITAEEPDNHRRDGLYPRVLRSPPLRPWNCHATNSGWHHLLLDSRNIRTQKFKKWNMIMSRKCFSSLCGWNKSCFISHFPCKLETKYVFTSENTNFWRNNQSYQDVLCMFICFMAFPLVRRGFNAFVSNFARCLNLVA